MVDANEIVQLVQKGGTRMTADETRKILSAVRQEAETHLNAVMVGVVMHHKAQSLAQELEVILGDAEATAQTAASRATKLEQEIQVADLAVRKAKAAKVMLPGSATQAQIAQADRAIQDAERVLQRANNNLRAAHTVTAQRQREVEDLRAIHRSLAAVKLPDLAPIRVLLDAVR
jgi:hypothetical protein